MTWIDELPTPSVLIEADRFERNLSVMQERANAQGVALRPHTKTHRSVAIARRQLASGAAGITVAKPGEAEVFAAAGFDDIRVAYTVVGEQKLRKLAALAGRISFCIDTIEGARAASAEFAGEGKTADVLVEIDIGYGRCGIGWDDLELPAFLRAVIELPGLRLVGILTHAGHSYDGPQAPGESREAALRRVMEQERDRMLAVAHRAQEAGVPGVLPGAFEISVGSTPSMRYFENRSHAGFRITEIRPGNYVFHDGIQVALGVARLDECALTVQATVVSRHRDANSGERVFLDSGKKVLTSDRVPGADTFGTLLYNPREMEPLPHARLTGLSEEHGWVRVPGGSTLLVGDRVRIVPNHACVVAATQSHVYLVRGEEVLETIALDAHGRSD